MLEFVTVHMRSSHVPGVVPVHTTALDVLEATSAAYPSLQAQAGPASMLEFVTAQVRSTHVVAVVVPVQRTALDVLEFTSAT